MDFSEHLPQALSEGGALESACFIISLVILRPTGAEVVRSRGAELQLSTAFLAGEPLRLKMHPVLPVSKCPLGPPIEKENT